MNNFFLIIIGWIVLLFTFGYILTFLIKEFIALIKAEAYLYHRTKFYKRRIKTREAETIALALNTVIHDYWDVKKTHPDCKEWGLVQWHDYYLKLSKDRKEKKHE